MIEGTLRPDVVQLHAPKPTFCASRAWSGALQSQLLPEKDLLEGRNGGADRGSAALIWDEAALLGSGMGKVVDAHTAVLRVGLPPSLPGPSSSHDDMAGDLGSRETYRFVSGKDCEQLLYAAVSAPDAVDTSGSHAESTRWPEPLGSLLVGRTAAANASTVQGSRLLLDLHDNGPMPAEALSILHGALRGIYSPLLLDPSLRKMHAALQSVMGTRSDSGSACQLDARGAALLAGSLLYTKVHVYGATECNGNSGGNHASNGDNAECRVLELAARAGWAYVEES